MSVRSSSVLSVLVKLFMSVLSKAVRVVRELGVGGQLGVPGVVALVAVTYVLSGVKGEE